jgi:hypothetical protein
MPRRPLFERCPTKSGHDSIIAKPAFLDPKETSNVGSIAFADVTVPYWSGQYEVHEDELAFCGIADGS